MTKKDIYRTLDHYVHLITEITSEIIREKVAYNKKVNKHIKDLNKARSEILKLADQLD